MQGVDGSLVRSTRALSALTLTLTTMAFTPLSTAANYDDEYQPESAHEDSSGDSPRDPALKFKIGVELELVNTA